MTHSTTVTIALLTLVVGLFAGYFFGLNTQAQTATQTANESEVLTMMQEERDYGMHQEDIIARDGAMQHAMEEMMFEFRGKTGEEYEKAFLRGMIVHHIGAIEMAEGLLEHTDRPELVGMAEDIIETQSQEVNIMKGWLDAWFTTNQDE